MGCTFNKMIAYNIHNWFKQAIMLEVQHHEISTLEEYFIEFVCVCGQIL